MRIERDGGIIVWDLDDTLIETFAEIIPRSHMAAVDAMIAAGLGVDRQQAYELRRATSAAGGDPDAVLAERFGASPAIVALGRTTYLSADVGYIAARTEVAAMLRRIGERHEQHLLTQGGVSRQVRKCIESGLLDCFDVVGVVSGDAAVGKRELLEAVLRAADGRTVIVVGDNPTNELAAARALGLPTIRVRTGEHATVETERHAAYREVTNVLEVEAALAEIEP